MMNISVNLTQSGVMELYKQFKLGNTLIKTHHQMNRREYEHIKSQIDPVDLIKDEMAVLTGREILKTHPNFISERPEGDKIIFYGEILAIEMNEFKSIVEAAIQMIPIEQLIEIKNKKDNERKRTS